MEGRSVPRELARLPGPLVPPDSAGEELDRLVDLVLQSFASKVPSAI